MGPPSPDAENKNSVTIGNVIGGIHNSIIAGRDVIIQIFTGSVGDERRDQRNRQVMLKAVQQFWVEGVLENSLHNAVLLELGMVEKREAVTYPWEMVLQNPHQPNLTLPQNTRMIDVFDQHQTLLILGEPGAGKTTMLLELARQTIARAESDPTQPMPVVFNLSSWAERRSPLAEWLVEELNTKYSIPKKIAQTWVDQEALLLLLDGLDEVAQAHRAACVEAINAFRKSSLMSVVVCSRVADYEGLVVKLNLAQAIGLQSFTNEQIDKYLTRFGSQLSSLRMVLQQDPNLLELAQSPLFLSVMTLAYQGRLVEDLRPLDTVEAQRKHIFDTYIQRMVERRVTNQQYSLERTNYWLTWLAQRMLEHSQSLFLIELMQPSWLKTPAQQRLYNFGFSLVLGLVFGLIVGLMFGWFWGLLVGLVLIALGSIFNFEENINPVELLRWSWVEIRNGLNIIAFHKQPGGHSTNKYRY